MGSYNVQEHINFRGKKLSKANIYNPLLPGLSLVEINPTELCNRVCSFCPRSNPKVYPNLNLNMKLETAQLISDQLFESNYDGEISVTGFGEPTLNKNILDIIAIFSSRFTTSMVTNGDNLLSSKLKLDNIVDSGLDVLTVDCYDGPDHFKKLYDFLLPLNKRINYKIRDMFDDGSSSLFEEFNLNNRGGILGEVKSVLRPCNLPMYKAMIDWNGDVLLCCNDWSRKEKGLGNVLVDNFSNLWTSNRFDSIRRELIKGNRKNIDACSGCNVDGLLVGANSFKLHSDRL